MGAGVETRVDLGNQIIERVRNFLRFGGGALLELNNLRFELSRGVLRAGVQLIKERFAVRGEGGIDRTKLGIHCGGDPVRVGGDAGGKLAAVAHNGVLKGVQALRQRFVDTVTMGADGRNCVCGSLGKALVEMKRALVKGIERVMRCIGKLGVEGRPVFAKQVKRAFSRVAEMVMEGIAVQADGLGGLSAGLGQTGVNRGDMFTHRMDGAVCG